MSDKPMSGNEEPAPRFPLGTVLRRTFGVVGRHYWRFLLVGLVVNGASVAFGAGLGAAAATVAPSIVRLSIVVSIVAAGAIFFLGQMFYQAVVVHACMVDFNGERPRLAASLRAALGAMLPLIVLFVLIYVSIVVGVILLVVPGILLGLRWCLIGPVVVMERPGIWRALRRSAALTRRHRWALLVLVFVISIPGLLLGRISLIALLPTPAQIQHPVLWTRAFGVVASCLGGMIFPAGISAAYAELCRMKEGVTRTLTAVFE